MIDIIIPHLKGWNDEKNFIKCVESIYKTTKDFHLTIVMHGAELEDLPFELKDNMTLVVFKENIGLAAGSNYALRLCKNEYIARIMDDVEVLTEDWENKFDKKAHLVNIAPTDKEALHGSFMIFKKSVIDEYGYLSQDFDEWGYDDSDYIRRLGEKGLTFIHQKGINFNHLGEGANESKKTYYREKNVHKFEQTKRPLEDFKWENLE